MINQKLCVAIYESQKQAERATKIRQSNIWKSCNDPNYSAGGFIWRYA